MSLIIEDGMGRRIHLRPIGVLEQMKLFKILGPELSVNSAYMHGAMIAAAVEQIDDVPLPFPVGETAIETTLARLGFETIERIGTFISSSQTEEDFPAAGN